MQAPTCREYFSYFPGRQARAVYFSCFNQADSVPRAFRQADSSLPSSIFILGVTRYRCNMISREFFVWQKKKNFVSQLEKGRKPSFEGKVFSNNLNYYGHKDGIFFARALIFFIEFIRIVRRKYLRWIYLRELNVTRLKGCKCSIASE